MAPLSKKTKKLLFFGAKLTLTAGMLYYVSRKVDLQKIGEILKGANWFLLLLAFLIFNISKIYGTLRLKAFLKAINIQINQKFNLIIFYIGLFFNFFLPGSVGGDAYKAYLIKQKHGGKTKDLLSAVLLERVSGLVALFFLAAGFWLLGEMKMPDGYTAFSWLPWLAFFGIHVAYFIGLYFVFRKFVPHFHITNLQSLVVQILQAVCAFIILKAFGVNEYIWIYLTVFMLATAIAAVPFTIGGGGARELVFVWAVESGWLNIDSQIGVAMSLTFFGITISSALIGMVFFLRSDYKTDIPGE